MPPRKGKSVFSMECHRYINHSAGQAPCPGIVGQHKMNSFVHALFHFFVLTSVFERKQKTKNTVLGKGKVERTWESLEERKEYNQNIFYEKIINKKKEDSERKLS